MAWGGMAMINYFPRHQKHLLEDKAFSVLPAQQSEAVRHPICGGFG